MTRCEIAIEVSPEETRAVVVEDGRAVEIHVDRAADRSAVGSIHVGRVDRVLPGMSACFVDIGQVRHAFLHVNDLLPERADEEGEETPTGETAGPGGEPRPDRAQPRIEDLVKPGQRVVVQVSREAFRTKGARVTTHLSLAGRALVLLPNARHVGVSKRIEPEAERDRLRAAGVQLRETTGCGVIVRTAASGMSEAELAEEMGELAARWAALAPALRRAEPPACLHSDLPLHLKILRDFLASEPARIVLDDAAACEEVRAWAREHAPALEGCIELHEAPEPLLAALGLEADLEKALRERVWLRSGGFLVIEPLEALVAIDVNTGKYTGKRSLEDTVLDTNLEAAAEVARQVRLRDLGGILVVDFIDMADPAHRERVLEAFIAALARDRARTTVLGMSEFGIVQVTRQRQRRSLDTLLTEPCPRCHGSGRILSAETVAYGILRRLRGIERGGSSAALVARVHPSVAAVLRERVSDRGSGATVRAAKLEIHEDASCPVDRPELGP